MFKQYIPSKTPVKVYRASDAGAPELKLETGSLKTLLKTCLVNGYGEGVNRKEPLGWQMFEETADSVTFYSDNTQGIGLKVENSEKTYIKAYMVGGSRFEQYLSYENKRLNNFSFNHDYAIKNWVLVGCERGFMLILPHQMKNNSQILFFGKINGLFEDDGNIAYINTSHYDNTYWDTGSIDSEYYPPLIIRSQWRDGGTLPLSAVHCQLFSPFSHTAVAFPDSLYQNTTASAIVIAEKNGAVRGTLPALFWCYHDLQGKINDLDPIDMGDGQKYIKLNISDSYEKRHCFVLNIEEWEL